MIDLRSLRSAPGEMRGALARRGDAAVDTLLNEIQTLDEQRRKLTGALDQLKARRNEAAQADAQLVKKQGALPAEIAAERRALGAQIGEAEAASRVVETDLEAKALFVPNPPLPHVP